MVRNMPKKQNMRQREKRQDGKSEKKAKGGRFEKTIGSLDIPDMTSEELMGQLNRMKAITSNGLAIQFNIKASMAKKLLSQLENDRVVEMVSRSHNLKVYALKN